MQYYLEIVLSDSINLLAVRGNNKVNNSHIRHTCFAGKVKGRSFSSREFQYTAVAVCKSFGEDG